jgi:hypothetical protein
VHARYGDRSGRILARGSWFDALVW